MRLMHCLDTQYQNHHPVTSWLKWTLSINQNRQSQRLGPPPPLLKPILTLRHCLKLPRKIPNINNYDSLSLRDSSHTAHNCLTHVRGTGQSAITLPLVITYGCRLLIPTKLSSEILTQLHKSHQGSIRTKQRAHLSVYWPGIDNDIDIVILSCKQCQDHLPSNPKEPIIQKPQPAKPFQEIAVDLCSHAGRTNLVIVDCLTDWPAVISLDHGTTSQQVIIAIRQSFCRTVIQDVVWSDGGPQFTIQ